MSSQHQFTKTCSQNTKYILTNTSLKFRYPVYKQVNISFLTKMQYLPHVYNANLDIIRKFEVPICQNNFPFTTRDSFSLSVTFAAKVPKLPPTEQKIYIYVYIYALFIRLARHMHISMDMCIAYHIVSARRF